jgi:hypothetical protein
MAENGNAAIMSCLHDRPHFASRHFIGDELRPAAIGMQTNVAHRIATFQITSLIYKLYLQEKLSVTVRDGRTE